MIFVVKNSFILRLPVLLTPEVPQCFSWSGTKVSNMQKEIAKKKKKKKFKFSVINLTLHTAKETWSSSLVQKWSQSGPELIIRVEIIPLKT